MNNMSEHALDRRIDLLLVSRNETGGTEKRVEISSMLCLDCYKYGNGFF